MRKKLAFINIMAIALVWLFSTNAIADPTCVRHGKFIYIYGDTVADDGDFDVFNALGLTVGRSRLNIKHWCWYGDDKAVGDVAELETADDRPVGCPMICNVADESQCLPSDLNVVVFRLYIDQLSHGSIIITLND